MYKDKKGDWFGVFLSICRLIVIGLLIVFIFDMNVKFILCVVIVFVIIVFYGVFVVFFFVGFFWNIGYGYFWCKYFIWVEDGFEVEWFLFILFNFFVLFLMMKNVDVVIFVFFDGVVVFCGLFFMGGVGVFGVGLVGGVVVVGIGLGRCLLLIEFVGDNVYEVSVSSVDGVFFFLFVMVYNFYGKEEIGYLYDL